jgi:hypothetical protein
MLNYFRWYPQELICLVNFSGSSLNTTMAGDEVKIETGEKQNPPFCYNLPKLRERVKHYIDKVIMKCFL